MKYIPAAVTSKVVRQALLFKKNSPGIMFGVGITGVAVSAVLACRATLTFQDVLEQAEKDKAQMQLAADTAPEKYTKQIHQNELRALKAQTVLKVAKLYAPAVGVGVVSVALLTGAHVTLSRRNAAVAAAYAALDRGFREYRGRVVAELGEEKDKEFRYGSELVEIVEEGEHGHEVKTVKRIADNGPSIYARKFEEGNTHWSSHPGENRNFVMVVQSWMNDRLVANGHVLLNDVYDALGFDRSKEGCVVGWVKDGLDKDGNPVGDQFVSFGLGEIHNDTYDFMAGKDRSIWLDFNVDGVVYDLIENKRRKRR